MNRKKRLWATLTVVACLMGLGVALISPIMVAWAKPYRYYDVATVPKNNVALVLGTIPTLSGGRPNLHFEYRIEAAAHLYKQGKVHHLLVSGDNHRAGYNEPEAMKQALVERGVPETAITLDYAGFRTLDSVVRAKEVFCLQTFTIVTDDFHASQAVFLGRSYGLNVVAFCSEDVPPAFTARVNAREVGARIKAFLDVYVLRTKPKFLGEKLPISVSS